MPAYPRYCPAAALVDHRTSECLVSETMTFQCGVDGADGLRFASMLAIFSHARHASSQVTYRALLSGSMNFTYGGFELNDEVISFDVDLQQIAEARLNFDRYRNG
jgi:hypothetical protein